MKKWPLFFALLLFIGKLSVTGDLVSTCIGEKGDSFENFCREKPADDPFYFFEATDLSALACERVSPSPRVVSFQRETLNTPILKEMADRHFFKNKILLLYRLQSFFQSHKSLEGYYTLGLRKLLF